MLLHRYKKSQDKVVVKSLVDRLFDFTEKEVADNPNFNATRNQMLKMVEKDYKKHVAGHWSEFGSRIYEGDVTNLALLEQAVKDAFAHFKFKDRHDATKPAAKSVANDKKLAAAMDKKELDASALLQALREQA